jgi:hypothetical protein
MKSFVEEYDYCCYTLFNCLKLKLFLAVIFCTSQGSSSHYNTDCIPCKHIYFTFLTS